MRILSCQNVATLIGRDGAKTEADYYDKQDWVLELESPLVLYTGALKIFVRN